jgi:hypothetical protein
MLLADEAGCEISTSQLPEPALKSQTGVVG